MFAHVPYLVKKAFPQLIWEVNTNKKEVYLTFDDGPHPEITPVVMEILADYKAKATFFCVGENVHKYPEAFSALIKNGHKLGNHTYNHLNGWKTPKEEYYDNIEKCNEVVDSPLFRPPYGRISLRHIPYLKMKYRIVMWSVLSLDFSAKVTPEKCLTNCLAHTKPGSIVVFHDSEKASGNMFYALPRLLEQLSNDGYSFPTL